MKVRSAALATLLLASCYSYDAPSEVLNGVAVVTQFTPGVTWGSYTTFSVDETITVVDNTGTVQTTCSVDSTQLLPTIITNMEARGYTEVPFSVTEHADLEIKLNAFLGDEAVYYPGYCGWYPYYYCYPGWTYAGSYNYGTLVLTMGDTLNATPGGKLPLVWTNADYGILSGYYTGCSGPPSAINWAKLQDAINQAFDDSPYIVGPPVP